MKDGVLLTGGTGFLGAEIAALLIRQTEKTIYVLVRAADEEHAAARLKAAWKDDELLYAAIGDRILPAAGDLKEKDLGLSGKMTEKIIREVRVVIHAAADVGVTKSRDELMQANRVGTKNILIFAKRIQKKGQLDRFVQISTAYVAGRKKGRILEDEPLSGSFCGYYEQSKANAEALVRKSGLPYAICRPGMIIGSSVDGHIRSFNTIYYVMKLIMTEKLQVLPISRKQKLNIVPVDYAAQAAVRIAFEPDAEGKVFHLTVPDGLCPSVGELVDYLLEWSKKNLGLTLRKVRFMPMPVLKKAGEMYNRSPKEKKKGILSNLLTLMPYFFDEHIFDRTNTDRLMGPCTLNWRDYADSMLAFACSKNFMKQTEDTIFMQAMVRRESRHYPVSYYDVKADGITRVSGPEMNRKILRAAAAMQARGIVPGMKVAMTGNNCTDYIVLDMAIGLCGAVSVPIYYTTPVEEINLLLERSGSEWFFIGDGRILKHLDDLCTGAKTVVFGAIKDEVHDKVCYSWDAFLGADEKKYVPVDVDPKALATIRYTSGTTGEPKGVMFSYEQLKWMGEVLTNLLDWKERNDRMRYLSFLPQSHVVEGILASYAPYCMLCRVDLYYLNDFGALTEALPKVRPTVFFSVPRFYEKVWQQLTQNRFGKIWLGLPDGQQKDLLGKLVRRVILKKAGLDQCGQLIVGSAPVSEELLQGYRKLGIEIHNAYGQTEAPLITINRKGDNILPSIGTVLPETEVEIAEDGELIVRGPQVSLGYYGLETDTIRDGVLKTGDLGKWIEKDHILLAGRKKEMIVTSYGKNINCAKIEERLKDIPEVTEAVLIGENRPFCTALVWLEGAEVLNAEKIEQMNRNLSHPEQIRKWTVVAKPLSIADGELTPNLKVRRNVVEEHYRTEIERMYESK